MTRRRRKETHSEAFWSRVARIEPQVIRRGVPVCESGRATLASVAELGRRAAWGSMCGWRARGLG